MNRRRFIVITGGVLATAIGRAATPPISTEERAAVDRSVRALTSLPQDHALDILDVRPFAWTGVSGQLVIWSMSRAGTGDRPHEIGVTIHQAGGQTASARLNGLPLQYLEVEGNFATAAANSNFLGHDGERAYFHIHVYNVLSGTGSMAAATDLLLSTDMRGTAPTVLFNLGRTGSFMKEGLDKRSSRNGQVLLGTRNGAPSTLVLRPVSGDSRCFVVTGTGQACSPQDQREVQYTPLARRFDEFLRLANQ